MIFVPLWVGRNALIACVPLFGSPSLSFKLKLPAFAASTDPGTRYGPLNQDYYFMDRLTQPNGHHVTIIGVFDGMSLEPFYATLEIL